MKALEGLRVLDLTHMLSGPYATLLLADMGAETIKVEPPGEGEATRQLLRGHPRYSHQGIGAYILTLGRNKRSIGIDLKSPEGLEIFYALTEKSDVVMTNYSAGVTTRLKIDHDTLAARNPGLVTCSLTGFGETGPDLHRPAFDQVIQGISGAMSITGREDTGPIRPGLPYADLTTGMFAAIGILGAVIARQTTGKGQHVDISMLDCQVSLMNYVATMYLLSGDLPRPLGNGHPNHVPYNSYPTQTQHIIIAVVQDITWAALVKVLDHPDLRKEAYLKREGRLADRAYLDEKIGEILKTAPAERWLEKLEAARVPSAPVNDYAQALKDPQILFRNMVIDVPQAAGGSVKMPGNPIKMSETYEDSYRPAPALGEDTDDILGGLLGMDPARIATLKEARIIS